MFCMAALAKTGTTLRSFRPALMPATISASSSSMVSKNFSISSSVAPAAVSISSMRRSSAWPASAAGTAPLVVLPPLVM